MQISSNYNTLFQRVSQLYGNAASKTSKVSMNSGSGSSQSSDQVDLSDDYLSFQSFLDKVKNGTVTDDDLSKIQDELNASQSQQMQMPPPPPPMQGTSSGEESNAIGSFLDKVKNGTVSTEDLANIQAVLSSTKSADGSQTVSSSGNSSELTFKSFLDKVKNGTVTDDDLTNMQSILKEMDQNRPAMPRPPMGMKGLEESGTSSSSYSKSTDSLTLQSFLDKIKNGTVTDDDLTEMQSMLTNWFGSAENSSTYAQSYAL